MRTFLALLIALSACKKKEETKPAAKPPDAAAKAPEPPPGPPPSAPQVIKVDGMSTPESVLYDKDADVYLVSNINGTPFDKDDNGFIARVSPPPDGRVVAQAWIDGKNEKVTLNAPKGMAILGGVLYVSDIDVVRMFDAKTGEPKGEVAIPGARFLNDVAAGDGVVYVSDSGLDGKFQPGDAQAIWEIRDGKPKKLIAGKELGGPNGLAVVNGELWVVTFGANELYKVKDGKREAVEKLPKGGLDGIVVGADGRIFISSWEGQTIFHGKPGGGWTGSFPVKSPADIGIDAGRNVLLVPIFEEGRVEIHEVPRG